MGECFCAEEFNCGVLLSMYVPTFFVFFFPRSSSICFGNFILFLQRMFSSCLGV
jgi:hypothetical protein